MIEKYLIVAIIIFAVGLFGIIKRQNLIMLFISTELLLNAGNLALLAGSKLHNDLDGQVFALFIMAVAAAEIAVGVALCVFWYKKSGSIELSSLEEVNNG